MAVMIEYQIFLTGANHTWTEVKIKANTHGLMCGLLKLVHGNLTLLPCFIITLSPTVGLRLSLLIHYRVL